MKRPILSIAVISAFTLISCEKQVVNRTNKTEPFAVKSSGEPTSNSTWFDNGGNTEGVDYGCSGAPMNCMSGTVVSPSIGDLVTDFGTSSNPRVFAQENYADLKIFIDEDLLDNVISGDNQVSFKGTISSSSHGYLIFKDGTKSKFVYEFGR